MVALGVGGGDVADDRRVLQVSVLGRVVGSTRVIRVRRGRLFVFAKAVPGPDAFRSVAVMAQKLEILDGVRSASGSRDDVVQGHVFEQVVITASVAAALLFLIEVSPRIGRNSCLVSWCVSEDAAAQLWDE